MVGTELKPSEKVEALAEAVNTARAERTERDAKYRMGITYMWDEEVNSCKLSEFISYSKKKMRSGKIILTSSGFGATAAGKNARR